MNLRTTYIDTCNCKLKKTRNMGYSVKNKLKLKKKSLFASYNLLCVFLSRICYILILEIIVVHNISIILLNALTLRT